MSLLPLFTLHSACLQIFQYLRDHHIEHDVLADQSYCEHTEECKNDSFLNDNILHAFVYAKCRCRLPEKAIKIEDHGTQQRVESASNLVEKCCHNKLVKHGHCKCRIDGHQPKEKLLLIQVSEKQISCCFELVRHPCNELFHETDWQEEEDDHIDSGECVLNVV